MGRGVMRCWQAVAIAVCLSMSAERPPAAVFCLPGPGSLSTPDGDATGPGSTMLVAWYRTHAKSNCWVGDTDTHCDCAQEPRAKSRACMSQAY